MDLQRLRYFVAVANELGFTRAARRLNVVQSAVSAAVRNLERELGVDLFERSSQGIALTQAGATLLPRAVAMLEAAEEARDAVLAGQGRLRGSLRIGGMTSVGLLDLPALLGRYHALHPDVVLRLHVSQTGSAGHVRGLLAGELDVAFVSVVGHVGAGLAARELATVPMVLLAPADHRLAGRGAVPLHELVDEPFVDSPAGYGNRDVVDRAFAAAGLGRRVALEATDVATMASFVRHGLGLAFVPEFVVRLGTEGLALLPYGGGTLHWSLSVMTSTKRHAPASLRALLSVLDAEQADFLDLPPS
jgi:DNA-binding transcriptional LysR family regulator